MRQTEHRPKTTNGFGIRPVAAAVLSVVAAASCGRSSPAPPPREAAPSAATSAAAVSPAMPSSTGGDAPLAVSALHLRRSFHSATRLGDGRVLVAGGNGERGGEWPRTTEIFDPRTGTWRAGPEMAHGYLECQAVALSDGRVLLVGRAMEAVGQTPQESAEIYDPRANRWSPAVIPDDPVSSARLVATADGRALLVGSLLDAHLVQAYDPGTFQWSVLSSSEESSSRESEEATVLPDGRVLVTGGEARGGRLEPGEVYATAETFDVRTRQWSAVARLAWRSVFLAS